MFGPYSISALEHDSYRRKTKGYLPSATIAFIYEIFKSNSATLNGLLPVLNERVCVNDGRHEELPLEMVVAASNELPAEREELDALWDRFQVSYLKGEEGSSNSSAAPRTAGLPFPRTRPVSSRRIWTRPRAVPAPWTPGPSCPPSPP